MTVAKRQRREKPMKTEERKVWGLEWEPEVKQTALLASPNYIGQAPGRRETYKKRSRNWACSAPYMSGDFVISSVLSHHSKNLKQPMDSSVLFGKQRKIHCEVWGQADSKDGKRESELKREGCLLHLRFSPWSSDLPLFSFHGLFPSLSFSQSHSGLPFPILTT